MEDILNKLLVADNSIILQGTKELKEAFKSPEAIPALCQLIVTSQNPSIRQSAAVILRKRILKSSNWLKLGFEIRNGIKQTLLQALVNEQDKLVKNCVAQLVGTIAKHETPQAEWVELLQFINTLCSSDNLNDKELGMFTLSIMTESCAAENMKHVDSFMFLFSNTLNNLDDLGSPVAYYTILTMIHFIPYISDKQQMVNLYHNLLPRILESIKVMSHSNPKYASECLEILDELLENAINVLTPHMKPVIELCLMLALDKEIDESIKIKAISFIGWFTKTKKKMITKHGLIEPIINTLFQLMSLPPDSDDGENDEEEYFDDSTAMTCASQTLDMIALNLPPEKLIPPLLRHIEPALQGNDMCAKRAAYLSMAILAEGCSDCIRKRYLQSFLQCIGKGITDTNPMVRNAALFALGQFSEHLQPEISLYASELLPVLFDFLQHLCTQIQTQNGKEPPSIDRMFYALEMFCENLEEELLPYLGTLMERLFLVLNNGTSVHLRELAITAIGATANAAKEHMLPFFPQILEILRVYLTTAYDDETICLQIQSIDTLGIIARTIGAANFGPLAQESLNLGLKLMSESDNPDLRKSCYGLFAALSIILKENLSPALPKMVEQMLDVIKSSEGFEPQYKEDDNPILDVYDESANEEDIENTDDEDDDDDDDDIAGYNPVNPYIEEKEEAVLALRELALNCGSIFLPYIETCFEEVFKLMNYPQDDIRKASIECLVQFCLCLAQIQTPEGKQALLKALSVFIPKCSEVIRMDSERAVVMAGLDAYGELLKEIKGDCLVGEGHREAIMNRVIDVMTSKTECQDQDGADEDDPEAEHDELLIESAGDIIPKFGKAIEPDDFLIYFNNLYTFFRMRTKSLSLAQRSFTIGIIAECMEPLQHNVQKFVPHLLELLIEGINDEHAEVRNNAIFAIGEMVFHGKEALVPFFPQILQHLSAALAKETHPGTLDNICGALARMIMVNVEKIPMDEVFPVFVRYLPLREDFNENKAVYQCITELYQKGHSELVKHLDAIIRGAATVVHKKQYAADNPAEDPTKMIITNLLKQIQQDFPDQLKQAATSLPEDVSLSVQQILLFE